MESPKHEHRPGNPLLEDDPAMPTAGDEQTDRTWSVGTIAMTVTALLIMAVVIALA
jgi:hypothetical protein